MGSKRFLTPFLLKNKRIDPLSRDDTNPPPYFTGLPFLFLIAIKKRCMRAYLLVYNARACIYIGRKTVGHRACGTVP